MVHVFYAICKSNFSNYDLEPLTLYPDAFRDKWNNIANEKHRIQSQLSKLILVDAFKALDLDLSYLKTYHVSSNGKPDVLSDTYFSISHSDHLVMVALATEAVGVDVQTKVTKTNRVLERVCSTSELDFFDSKEQLWTRKEAVIKLFGDSIMNGKKYSVRDNQNTNFHVSNFEVENQFSCALAMKGEISQKEIQVKKLQY